MMRWCWLQYFLTSAQLVFCVKATHMLLIPLIFHACCEPLALYCFLPCVLQVAADMGELYKVYDLVKREIR